MPAGFVRWQDENRNSFRSPPVCWTAERPNLSLGFVHAFDICHRRDRLKSRVPDLGIVSVIDDEGGALFGPNRLWADAAVTRGGEQYCDQNALNEQGLTSRNQRRQKTISLGRRCRPRAVTSCTF